jgi:putative ABC transport system permease protein
MLSQFIHDPIYLAAAQALVAGAMALVMMVIASVYGIRLEKEIVISLVRGLVQVVAVGSILLFIFDGPTVLGFAILAGMTLLAAKTAEKRAGDLPGAFRVSFWGILIGAGSVIILMTLAGVIDTKLTALIPIGSMIVANSMNAVGLALDRLQGEVRSHVGHIEAALALGADPRTAVKPYTQAAIKASLIPRIDSLRSLGIVWIPGVMTGMLLGGSQPIEAALYQFVIMAMILTISGLASLVSALLMAGQIFTPAAQLIIGRES